ncbi:Hypothetical predicted protein [Mytilus galloprovincialis]|uniref:RNase H type-1 domain-containing protein n=1 Tax=Mytilus galloprovincialis TaxID=29158 RepID=A0A8B6EKG2_MYTGA|nr:Hypothetical predicted protein [Mytilus galloprovincialis]
MEEISVRGIANIQSKYKAELIKHQLEEYLTNNETYERQESPFDGSCQGNPGTCGAGAVIYTENHQGTSLKRPVASRGSILLAELVAILMVLEHCI